MRSAYVLLAAVPLACGGEGGQPAAEQGEVVFATTTSVDDSGLMDVLLPAFAEAHPGIDVKLIAVGSGEALAMGRRKDADLLLTHAPFDEARFVTQGYAERTKTIMYNHFVIAGPDSDPAGVRGAASAADAFRRIADTKTEFITRADSSGTHRKELRLWEDAGVQPGSGSSWYSESGVGMGDLLRVAAERNAYTLSDRASMLRLGVPAGLVILYDDASDDLYNPYSATPVTGAANAGAAQVLFDWLVGPAQEIIGAFGTEPYGRPLFVPAGT